MCDTCTIHSVPEARHHFPSRQPPSAPGDSVWQLKKGTYRNVSAYSSLLFSAHISQMETCDLCECRCLLPHHISSENWHNAMYAPGASAFSHCPSSAPLGMPLDRQRSHRPSWQTDSVSTCLPTIVSCNTRKCMCVQALCAFCNDSATSLSSCSLPELCPAPEVALMVPANRHMRYEREISQCQRYISGK